MDEQRNFDYEEYSKWYWDLVDKARLEMSPLRHETYRWKYFMCN